MATFKVQIEDLVGAVGDDAALTQWLQDGTREIISILPPYLKGILLFKTNFYFKCSQFRSRDNDYRAIRKCLCRKC